MKSNNDYMKEVLKKAISQNFVKKEEIRGIEDKLNEITNYGYNFKELYEDEKEKEKEENI